MPTTWRKSLALLLFAQQVPCKVSFNDTSKKVSIVGFVLLFAFTAGISIISAVNLISTSLKFSVLIRIP